MHLNMKLAVIAAAVALAACGKKEEAMPAETATAPAAAPAAAAPEGGVIKIGHVGPTSGAIAHLGKDNENGAKMAIEELNAAGLTINGAPATYGCRPEAGRRQSGWRDRPPELRYHHSSFTDLQRRWHPSNLSISNQPQVHPPGLRRRVPYGG